MKSGTKYIMFMTDGLEIIGQVKSVTDHTLEISNPCLLTNLFHPQFITDLTWYSKNKNIIFNRDLITCEYEPSEKIVEIYTAFLNNVVYPEVEKRIASILELHLKRVREATLDEKIGPILLEDPDEILQQMTEKMTQRRKQKLH